MNIISRSDLHMLLRNLSFLTKNSIKIKKDFIEETVDEFDEDISWLIGYTIKRKVVGDHRNDGQIVDYTFTFVSPKNKKTILETEMCLMVGWNFHENEYKIK